MKLIFELEKNTELSAWEWTNAEQEAVNGRGDSASSVNPRRDLEIKLLLTIDKTDAKNVYVKFSHYNKVTLINLALITWLHDCWKREEVCEDLLAHHVSRLLVNKAGRSVTAETLVHLALVSLEPGRAHALHAAATWQRARPRVHAVVVADVWCTSRKKMGKRKREMSALEMWLKPHWLGLYEALMGPNYPHQMTS